ncbi:MAG TPA: TetR family transcriptional regulator [Nocardioides sp.]|nr:TetR family transcriptional regulator [Nocardioides sp.]
MAADRAVRRTRRTLTREEILDAAVVLVDAEGLAALSMRRLADSLGVGAMTVYGFVANKEELVSGLAAHVLGGLEADVPDGLGWRATMVAELDALRGAIERHPGLLELLSVGVEHMPLLDRTRERLVAVLRAEGFGDDAVVDGLGALVALSLGFTVGASLRSGSLAESYGRLADLDGAEFPHLRALGADYAAHWSRRAWLSGVEALLDGMERRRDAVSG